MFVLDSNSKVNLSYLVPYAVELHCCPNTAINTFTSQTVVLGVPFLWWTQYLTHHTGTVNTGARCIKRCVKSRLKLQVCVEIETGIWLYLQPCWLSISSSVDADHHLFRLSRGWEETFVTECLERFWVAYKVAYGCTISCVQSNWRNISLIQGFTVIPEFNLVHFFLLYSYNHKAVKHI